MRTPLRTIWCTHLGLSERAWEVLSISWSKSTFSSYQTAARKWLRYTRPLKIDPVRPTIFQCVDFLVSVHDGGVGHGTVATTRSFLSNFITIEGRPLGEHPLASRIVRGTKNADDTEPPYEDIWDPVTVLQNLRDWGDIEDLSLDRLTRRTLTLFLIATGQRLQALYSLLRSDIIMSENSMRIKYKTKLKSNNPKTNPLVLRFIRHEDKRLCVFTHIVAYLGHPLTKGAEPKVFGTVKVPVKEASPATVSRLVKQTLAEAGIDACYGAYSARHASTSGAARAKIPLNQIMASAGWKRESTFTRFYNRPLRVDIELPETNFIPTFMGGAIP
jgi:hypothetical protein